jgi:hypothetical protein
LVNTIILIAFDFLFFYLNLVLIVYLAHYVGVWTWFWILGGIPLLCYLVVRAHGRHEVIH